jgi:uncharacterized RDD family membrane protein YckC
MNKFCVNCGNELDVNAVFCTKCGTNLNQPIENNNPVYAGFWLRYFAYMIDGIILGIVFFALGLSLGYLFPDMFETEFKAQLFGNLIEALIGWAYFALLESSEEQGTYGKRILGLKVVDENYQRMTLGRATGRHFAKILSTITLLFGYIMAGFTEKKQALHDIVAKTYVIKK